MKRNSIMQSQMMQVDQHSVQNQNLNNTVVLTFDVDWAPDFVIDFVAEQLIKYQVRATWFVTHSSPAIEQLRKYPDLFELGIHPNFLVGSTHGADPKSILEHCMNLVPEAITMRTHGLVQSSYLLGLAMNETPITIDVSLFLPHVSNLCPFEYWWETQLLIRVPYFWEDDFEMENPNPYWHIHPLVEKVSGLKIFDFHPIHVYLNSANMQNYRILKQNVSKLTEAMPSEVESYVHQEEGTQTLFIETIKYLSNTENSFRIRDVVKDWQNSIERGEI